MNITNRQFSALCNLVDAIAEDKNMVKKYPEINEAVSVIEELKEKKRQENIYKAVYTANKRKMDPTYAGGDWYAKHKKGEK